MGYATVRNQQTDLAKRLGEPGYADTYDSESAFEAAVWERLVEFMRPAVKNPYDWCLTSHKELPGRSAAAWEAFRREDCGPDLKVLRSNNRLDIVVKHPVRGSIGVEVKCLGGHRHAAKLTQGVGQAMLASAHRSQTLLVIHCGTVDTKDRDELRKVADQICRGTRLSIIVVP